MIIEHCTAKSDLHEFGTIYFDASLTSIYQFLYPN